MASEEPDRDNAITKAAPTAGAASGAVASKAADFGGAKSDAAPGGSARKPRKDSTASDRNLRAQEQKRAKRAKHRRKLHRKTRG
jgi:hypothetical protein